MCYQVNEVGDSGIPLIRLFRKPRSDTVSTVYALSATLGLVAGSTKDAVLDALDGNVLAQGTLTGTYER